MRKIKVGIIQQANTADLRTNLMNLAKRLPNVMPYLTPFTP